MARTVVHWFVSAGSSEDGEGDSPWALPVLVFALCAITTVSLFLNGTAAIVLLGLALAAAVVGVPTLLTIGHLRDRTIRYRPPAT